jgi:hypothetical protein
LFDCGGAGGASRARFNQVKILKINKKIRYFTLPTFNPAAIVP